MTETVDRTPTWTELFKMAGDAVQGKIHTVAIGRVVTYNTDNQTVDVQPNINLNLGGDEFVRPPVLTNVPIAHLDYGDWSIIARPKVGHDVILLINERSLDEYLLTGNDDIDPRDPRRHDYLDAIALPGLRAYNASLSPADGELVVGKSDGSTKITIEDGTVTVDAGTIKLGSGASDNVVLAEFFNLFDTHTHPDPVSGNSGPPTTTTSAYVGGALKTSKTEAE